MIRAQNVNISKLRTLLRLKIKSEANLRSSEISAKKGKNLIFENQKIFFPKKKIFF